VRGPPTAKQRAAVQYAESAEGWRPSARRRASEYTACGGVRAQSRTGEEEEERTRAETVGAARGLLGTGITKEAPHAGRDAARSLSLANLPIPTKILLPRNAPNLGDLAGKRWDL